DNRLGVEAGPRAGGRVEDISNMSAIEAIRRFRSRELSPVELTEAVLARADATERAINAFTVLYPDEAVAGARESESRYLHNRPRPLDGVPVAIKELTP